MSITIIDPRSWYGFLEVIRKRPGMYFGKPSLSGLHHYINGMLHAEHVYNIPQSERMHNKENDFDWIQFEDFVQKKNKRYIRSFLIPENLTPDISDEDAFKLWFSWYDEFNTKKGKKNYEYWKKNQEPLEFRQTKDTGDPSKY